jgi:electron transfer DM13
MTPLRAALIGGSVVLLGAAGWYLGSPLFIRTTVIEAPPSAAVRPASTVAGASAPAPATVAAPVTLARGELQYVDAIHNGKGTVVLLLTGDGTVLRFDDVAITNAPDVHVYLSTGTGGAWSEATSLYLGPLKATNGSFNYAVPATDVSRYKSVVVWCRQFSVLVTWADLRR